MRNWLQEFTPKLFVCLRDKYSLKMLQKDLVAGLTVGILALPIAMAIGIACGLTPEHGIFTAIVAGFLISLLGGSRVQVGGPTAAFVAVIYVIVQHHGYEGLAVATLLAGAILIVAALLRIGKYIKYVPYPLVAGFTTGIALLLFSSQVKDFLGLKMGAVPADFVEKWGSYFANIQSIDPWTAGAGLFTLATIIAIRKVNPTMPWAILSIIATTALCYIFHLPLETIYDRFGQIQASLPFPKWPEKLFDLAFVWKIMPDAIAIALLAGIESLVSAVIADGLSGDRHKSNCELLGQGIANIASALFGGIPATAALARTATNIRSGALTPIAGMIHAFTVLLILLFFAPFVRHIPLAALSAVLIMVAWNLSEWHQFRRLFKAPKGDIAVLLTAFFFTVFFDITTAVEIGVVLACFLFMKRMSDVSQIIPALEEQAKEEDKREQVYEIHGPLFFGIAHHLKDLHFDQRSMPNTIRLCMKRVVILDASGMSALHELHHKCQNKQITLVLSGTTEEIERSLGKFGLASIIQKKNI